MKSVLYEGNQHFSVCDTLPVPPCPGEVQLQVTYCGICGTDVHIYHGAMDGRVNICPCL